MKKRMMRRLLVLVVLSFGPTVADLRIGGWYQQHEPGVLSNGFTLPVAMAEEAQPDKAERAPDVVYVPTAHEVVAEMLRVTAVKKQDVVYDLGCGDGRIVITAAQKIGARGVGVDIDPQRIKESRENARKADVTNLVKFLQQDLFKTNISEATVVTLYLLPTLNVKLRPKLFQELKPGTRIASHDFDMGEWKPDEVLKVKGPTREHTVYYWVIPANVSGAWEWSLPTAAGEQRYTLQLDQKFQEVSGTLKAGEEQMTITDAKLSGDTLSFTLAREVQGKKVTERFSGRVNGNAIEGNVEAEGEPAGKRNWTAKRDASTVKPLGSVEKVEEQERA